MRKTPILISELKEKLGRINKHIRNSERIKFLCNRCNELKTREEFCKSKRNKSGVSSYCKKCNNIR